LKRFYFHKNKLTSVLASIINELKAKGCDVYAPDDITYV